MRRGAIVALPLFFGSLACTPAARTPGPNAPCASLDPVACERARGLLAAASTYADEAHEYVLRLLDASSLSAGSSLARSRDGWRAVPPACARAMQPPSKLELGAVDYAFVGIAIDSALVSADADVGPFLARADPPVHDVSLVALAFVRDLAAASFRRGAALVETASGACTCEGATHYAGEPKYGAALSYAFRVPRARLHARARDFVRDALADRRVMFRESRAGSLSIDGLARTASSGPSQPLAFHVHDPALIAFVASPIEELCDFPPPEVSPSPLDFGVAPYGTEVQRTVHVTNRAPIDLRALLGAQTVVVPAGGAADLTLHWTPDGDAPGCETQTRDESIPFLRLNGVTPRSARVFETIRTGRATLERAERVVPIPPKLDLASTVRDWTCPPDFVRTSCKVENASAPDVVVEPRGDNACHYACRAGGPGQSAPCRFDAIMTCALHCAP